MFVSGRAPAFPGRSVALALAPVSGRQRSGIWAGPPAARHGVGSGLAGPYLASGAGRMGEEKVAVDGYERLVELIHRAAAGRQDAFAELYDLTAARVHGVIAQVVKSADAASEVGQDVFVEVWRRCPGYDAGRGSVVAWMLTIAHRKAVDRVRAAARTTGREKRDVPSDPGPQPDDRVGDETRQHWEADRVRSALEQLSAPQRDALMLAYFQGYSQTQVADRLQMPLGTVKTGMRDGLARLHDELGMQR